MVHEKALSSDTMGVAICRPRAKVLAIRSRNASLILLSGSQVISTSGPPPAPWSTPGRQQLLVEIPLCFLYPRFHLHNAASPSSHNHSVEGRTSAATLAGLSKCFSSNSKLRVSRVIATSKSGSRISVRPPSMSNVPATYHPQCSAMSSRNIVVSRQIVRAYCCELTHVSGYYRKQFAQGRVGDRRNWAVRVRERPTESRVLTVINEPNSDDCLEL